MTHLNCKQQMLFIFSSNKWERYNYFLTNKVNKKKTIKDFNDIEILVNLQNDLLKKYSD